MPWREGGLVRIVSVATNQLLGVPWAIAVPPDADELEDEVLRIHRDALDAADKREIPIRSIPISSSSRS